MFLDDQDIELLPLDEFPEFLELLRGRYDPSGPIDACWVCVWQWARIGVNMLMTSFGTLFTSSLRISSDKFLISAGLNVFSNVVNLLTTSANPLKYPGCGWRFFWSRQLFLSAWISLTISLNKSWRSSITLHAVASWYIEWSVRKASKQIKSPALLTKNTRSSSFSMRILRADIKVFHDTRASKLLKYADKVWRLNIEICSSSAGVESGCFATNNCINLKSSSTANGYCVGYGVMFLKAHWRFWWDASWRVRVLDCSQQRRSKP